MLNPLVLFHIGKKMAANAYKIDLHVQYINLHIDGHFSLFFVCWFILISYSYNKSSYSSSYPSMMPPSPQIESIVGIQTVNLKITTLKGASKHSWHSWITEDRLWYLNPDLFDALQQQMTELSPLDAPQSCPMYAYSLQDKAWLDLESPHWSWVLLGKEEWCGVKKNSHSNFVSKVIW